MRVRPDEASAAAAQEDAAVAVSVSSERHHELLEAWTPLSESVLWRLQRAFYERSGPSAWRSTGPRTRCVPSYITSNAFVASAYARAVLELVRQVPDGARCFLLELGSGSGQFAFLFVQQWLRLCSEQDVEPTSLCYVLSDFVLDNVVGFQQHRQLRQLAEQGLVDFALIDALQQNPFLSVELLHSGGSLANVDALVLVCNYVFDSLPHDLYRFDADADRRRIVRVDVRCSTRGAQADASADVLDSLKLDMRYTSTPSEALPPLVRASADDGLNAHVLYPVGAISVLTHFVNTFATSIPCLALIADKRTSATSSRSDATPSQALCLAQHGSVSIAVNFEILSKFARRNNAELSFCSAARSQALHIAAFGWGLREPRLLRRTVDAQFGSFGVSDFFELQSVLCSAGTASALSLRALMSANRLSAFDAHVFYKLSSYMIAEVEYVDDDDVIDDMISLVERVEKHAFFVAGSVDVWFELGRLCYALCESEAALRHYGASELFYGRDATTSFNKGLAELALGNDVGAKLEFERALQLRADYTQAQTALDALNRTEQKEER